MVPTGADRDVARRPDSGITPLGHVVSWQASNRLFALAIDAGSEPALVVWVVQEMSAALTTASGSVEDLHTHLRPGIGRQAITLSSPQLWVMFVGEAR